MTEKICGVLTMALLSALLLMAPVLAQQADGTADADEVEAAAQQGAPMADEEDQIAAEDAAVEEVLSEAELIYRDDEENGDFVPSESVSADQSLDYPIDI